MPIIAIGLNWMIELEGADGFFRPKYCQVSRDLQCRSKSVLQIGHHRGAIAFWTVNGVAMFSAVIMGHVDSRPPWLIWSGKTAWALGFFGCR